VLIQKFDDDAGLRNCLALRAVAHDRKFPDRPQLLEILGRGCVGQIDDVRREDDVQRESGVSFS
jgi:hypothetical protein